MKQNGFLEDVIYHSRFDSEEQIKNTDLFFSINEKSTLQITKISKNDNDELIDEDFVINDQNDDQDDDQNSLSDFLDIPFDDQISNISKDEKNTKILPKLPKTKYYHYKDYKPIVNRAIK